MIRKWTRDALAADATFVGMLSNGASSIFGAGSLTGRPDDDTFVVLRFMEPTELAEGVPARRRHIDVWAHDRSGGYTTIDDVLARAQTVLLNAPRGDYADLVKVLPAGEGPDLADDDFGTLTRTATLTIVEKWAQGGPR